MLTNDSLIRVLLVLHKFFRMTLIKSISGIRGTIGGLQGDNLSPVDIVRYAIAYGQWIKQRQTTRKPKIILGRDARMSGRMVSNLISASLAGTGCDVIDIGLATTPTTEMAVGFHHADGGIIITASHNPAEWNALKLLNEKGEFLSATEGEHILRLAENETVFQSIEYATIDKIGQISQSHGDLEHHIRAILDLPYINATAIAQANFKVAIDCVNSVGGIAIPALLKALGINQIVELYTEPNGKFPHNPEPLPENLTGICSVIKKHKADVGFVVDPDVDRLALVDENGDLLGEENTLVAIADYFLSIKQGNTVSNLSSSRALADITHKHGGNYAASAVGEVNVVKLMKDTGAVIGGEGNGGIILPDLHYGRDALVGIALFLSYMAVSKHKCSHIRASLPEYFISKNKISLNAGVNVDQILEDLKNHYQSERINTIDGVKIDFEDKWVHLRKSNTEPIIRIYAEAKSMNEADALIHEIQALIQ